MKQYGKCLIALLMSAVMILNLVACGMFDEAGEDIAESYVDHYVNKVEFDSSLNDPAPNGSSYKPNGEILYETVLFEDILKEDIKHESVLNEEIIEEKILNELLYDEGLLYEDVIIETIHVEIIDDVTNLDESFVCESYYSQEFDYAFIKQRIAAGCSLILAEVVVDLGSCILNIVTANWGGVALDAGQIIVTAGGSTLAGFVAYHIAKAKSEAAGNSYEQVMYDALYEGSNAFYYTAVACDVVNTVISLYQFAKLVKSTVVAIKGLIKALKTPEIVDDAGKVIAKLRADGFYDVSLDGQKAIKCAFAENSTDLYDATTKAYVCSIIKNGDALSAEIRKLPKQVISSRGCLKYEIDEASNIFKITTDSGGGYVRTTMGKIDAGGFVKNGFGQIIDRIDFVSGQSLGSYAGVTKIAPNISVDVFGEIVDLNSGKTLALKTIEGVQTYVDSEGKAVAKVYKGKDGANWLKNINDVDNGKTIGRISADGVFESSWKTDLDFLRQNATNTIRENLVAYVKKSSDSAVRKNFPELTLEQIEYIRKYGRIPTSIEIHHCKNVANYPDLADDFSNLEVMSKESHLKAHKGNYQNSTVEKSKNYVNLRELFGL